MNLFSLFLFGITRANFLITELLDKTLHEEIRPYSGFFSNNWQLWVFPRNNIIICQKFRTTKKSIPEKIRQFLDQE